MRNPAIFALLSSIGCVLACGSDATVGSNLPSSSTSSSGGATFKTCTDAELDADDHLATGADVSANNTVAQYTPHCVRIKVGKSVGFYGPFTQHPISGNGEAGNPIPKVSSGTDSGRITFPAAGTFGFHCEDHPDVMYGAVKVVP